MSAQPLSPGLYGVVADETAICEVSEEGLRYRGYAVEELAEECCFEEVAHLLVYDALPTRTQLSQLRDTLATFRVLPSQITETLRLIPTNVPMMEVLRTAVSMCGHVDRVPGTGAEDVRRRAIWLTSAIASIITTRVRIARRQPVIEPKPGLSHAAQLLYQIHGEVPSPPIERLLDRILILCAEHEFNASTFTARIIASTRSDQVSSIVGAIGALKGSLLGGAAEQAMAMLERFENGEQAARWVAGAIARKERIMGFGHRIYRRGDPRAVLLDGELRRLADEKGMERWLEVYDAVKRAMEARDPPLFANVEFPCGLIFLLMGLGPDLYTPLVTAARVTGWSAHFIEQHSRTHVYRPSARYGGPPARPVPELGAR